MSSSLIRRSVLSTSRCLNRISSSAGAMQPAATSRHSAEWTTWSSNSSGSGNSQLLPGSSTTSLARRYNFSFTGPRKLDEILKTDMIRDKSGEEVSELWRLYHEGKENTFGTVIDDGKVVLERAKRCPFFIQPVFREEGFFTMVSQFQDPAHFFLAYLEDYKLDPNNTNPLVTFSVFSELADTLGIHLVRCEVINRGIHDEEGRRAVENILNMYGKDTEFEKIRQFNEQPDVFDFDDFISYQNQKWKDASSEPSALSASSPEKQSN